MRVRELTRPFPFRGSLSRVLDGPPVALPTRLDRSVERWWRLPPRTRLVLTGLLVLVLAIAPGIASSRPHPATEVLVAVRQILAGRTVTAGDVALLQRPAEHVPDGALTTLPSGAEALGTIPAGAVVTSHDVAIGGIAATLEAGRVAVAVPLERLPGGLREGTRVDLLAANPDGTPDVLAASARVLMVEDTAVWFDVPRDQASRVAAAVTWGNVGVALLPPDGRADPHQ